MSLFTITRHGLCQSPAKPLHGMAISMGANSQSSCSKVAKGMAAALPPLNIICMCTCRQTCAVARQLAFTLLAPLLEWPLHLLRQKA